MARLKPGPDETKTLAATSGQVRGEFFWSHGEGIAEGDAPESATVLQVFAEQQCATCASRCGPEECVPELKTVLLVGGKGFENVVSRG